MTRSKKQLAGYHRRRLVTMQKQVLEMSREWEDLDQFCVNELEKLADQVKEAAAGLAED
ncbi:hypothetical protein [Delftia lacustris]|uniref:hypothetical protein n=1 Tax=Delftia lacustris TaxID=558537 RepID=UPI002D773217|nr:hypothetical protein [Delftia lacustris]